MIYDKIIKLICRYDKKIELIDKFLEIENTKQQLPKYFLDKIIEIKNSSIKAIEN